MASVTGGKRSDAKHMCKCGRRTLYYCRMLGEYDYSCVLKEKRAKAAVKKRLKNIKDYQNRCFKAANTYSN